MISSKYIPNQLEKLKNGSESNENKNFKVVIRLRPFSPRELESGKSISTVASKLHQFKFSYLSNIN